MLAPLVWIGIPLVAAAVLLSLRHWQGITTLSGALIAALLAGIAWRLPIGTPVALGPLSLKLDPLFSVLGRQFVISNPDRPLLVLIYGITAIWFVVAFFARPNPTFAPVGMAIVALLSAAAAVDPFLYAALFIEIAILVSIPLLLTLGREAQPGLLRYLTFLTLGMPFILFTGWLLTGVEASPGELALVVQASVLLGFGFTLLLAIFPFHTWIPMLAEEVHPLTAGFVLFIVPGIISLFGVSFLDRYAWLRASDSLYFLLRSAGALMVVTGGLWAAFQRRLDRMLGYAVVAEGGMALLALGLGTAEGVALFFALLMTRGVALVLWSLSLAGWHGLAADLKFTTLQGLGRAFPLLAAGGLIAHFSLAGFPAMAGFPVRLRLWQALSPIHPLAAWLSLVGSLGLMIGAARTMAVLVMTPVQPDSPDTEAQLAISTQVLLIAGVIAVLVLGLWPQLYHSATVALAGTYPNLAAP